MMKYMILIRSNPAFRDLWEELTEEERIEFGRRHMALTRELEASGEYVAGEGLADPSQATLVRLRDGRTIATDGPHPEVKEHVVGFYLVDCETPDRAIEIAARVPDAEYGGVEVWPALDLSFLDQ